MSIDSVNDIQRYLGEEMIEQHRDGSISRRELVTKLVAICGSTAVASAFLAACGDNGGATATSTTATSGTASTSATSGASSTTAGAAATTPATSSSGLATRPPTTQGPGAVLSVAADDPAIKGDDVSFPGAAGTVLGYIARPAGGPTAKRPGVIVIHENTGLTAHIKDVTRRLAKAGYVAVAVDLASRQGGTAKVGSNITGALSQLSGDDAVADMNAGVTFLEGQADYSGKLGITGFCYGGGMVLRFAANQTKVKAAVPYYGTPPAPTSQMANTVAAILAHYGATDTRVDATIPDLEANLVGKTYEKRVWDGAGHAFNNDTGGAYNASVAVRAWTDTLSWFARYLA
jgi:carboxymethylenebutenolidase